MRKFLSCHKTKRNEYELDSNIICLKIGFSAPMSGQAKEEEVEEMTEKVCKFRESTNSYIYWDKREI